MILTDENENFSLNQVGEYCFSLAEELWPINRSLTGPGVRATLDILKRELPDLLVHSARTGEAVFDWTVPDEWIFRHAYIEAENGERVIDAAQNNLHVVGYSEPVDTWLSREELLEHVYTQPDQPDAIPYVTSYYKRRWGFCMSEVQKSQLPSGRYRAVIDADLGPGEMNYGELLIRGKSSEEIFLSTYICHPSMANNELSGPVVTTALGQWILGMAERKYSYRIVFVPETIGSVLYLSRNLEHMKQKVFAGCNVSCVGDDRCYSFLPSRASNTIADRVAQHVLHCIDPDFKKYSWLDRGSDERQYCAPGADLPVATIMRSKYGMYPEYHTSLDTLNGVVTAKGLAGGFTALRQAIEILEQDFTPRVSTIGEPQLGKRGLYPDISRKGSANSVKNMMDMLSYSDGTRSLFEIAELLAVPFAKLRDLAQPLVVQGLLHDVSQRHDDRDRMPLL